jgi:hypothetical protein
MEVHPDNGTGGKAEPNRLTQRPSAVKHPRSMGWRSCTLKVSGRTPGRKRQTTMGEVRFDPSKAKRSSASRNQLAELESCRARGNCFTTPKTREARSWPRNPPGSVECRCKTHWRWAIL